jgi:hypothetical protein
VGKSQDNAAELGKHPAERQVGAFQRAPDCNMAKRAPHLTNIGAQAAEAWVDPPYLVGRTCVQLSVSQLQCF